MVLVSPTRDTHPRKLCPQGLWGAQWLHTHRTPRPLPHGSDWRVILEGKQGFSQARPEHSRMRKTHAQGGWKGCRVLGERQRGTVSGDGAGRTAGSGLWGRGWLLKVWAARAISEKKTTVKFATSFDSSFHRFLWRMQCPLTAFLPTGEVL